MLRLHLLTNKARLFLAFLHKVFIGSGELRIFPVLPQIVRMIVQQSMTCVAVGYDRRLCVEPRVACDSVAI